MRVPTILLCAFVLPSCFVGSEGPGPAAPPEAAQTEPPPEATPPPPAPAAAPVAAPAPSPPAAQGQVLRAKHVEARTIRAHRIIAKHVDAKGGRVGRVLEGTKHDEPWRGSDAHVKMDTVTADTIYAEHVKADWIEADEIQAEHTKIGK